jgi:hypothetical protein
MPEADRGRRHAAAGRRQAAVLSLDERLFCLSVSPAEAPGRATATPHLSPGRRHRGRSAMNDRDEARDGYWRLLGVSAAQNLIDYTIAAG